VVVVETKWSSDPWQTGRGGNSFTPDRLARAVEQTRRNAADIATQLGRVRGDTPVRAVLALWSPVDAIDLEGLNEAHGVHVMAGARLRSWVEALEDLHLDADAAGALWLALDKQARVRDERDVGSGSLAPTVGQLLSRWVWQPSGGFVVAVYGMAGIVRLPGTLVQALAMISSGLGCLIALRRSGLHQAALGASAAFVTVVALAAVAVVGG
jgi:hypothetical protein